MTHDCHAMPCHAMPCHAMPCLTMLVPHPAMPCPHPLATHTASPATHRWTAAARRCGRCGSACSGAPPAVQSPRCRAGTARRVGRRARGASAQGSGGAHGRGCGLLSRGCKAWRGEGAKHEAALTEDAMQHSIVPMLRMVCPELQLAPLSRRQAGDPRGSRRQRAGRAGQQGGRLAWRCRRWGLKLNSSFMDSSQSLNAACACIKRAARRSWCERAVALHMRGATAGAATQPH